jgi:glutamate/tyrosine decarboxylase-like PLP-dependent enzyme
MLICTEYPHTHHSLIKAAKILNLKIFQIKDKEGVMDLEELEIFLNKMTNKKVKFANFIVSSNFGTCNNGLIDDFFGIKALMDKYLSINPLW